MAWLVAVLMAAPGPARVVAGAATMPTAPAPCRGTALPGLAAQFARARRVSARADGGLDAGPAADYGIVARAVLGAEADPVVVAPDAPAGPPPLPDSRCGAAAHRRDQLAWQLGLAGYSPREIADVIEGHLTRADLDQARVRLMAGHATDAVAGFLESRWRDPLAEASARVARADAMRRPWPAGRGGTMADLEGDLVAFAAEHQVPVELVRAVIAAESAGNPRAMSPAGAIGLMQLMPGTAAALGVDPWQPRENLRGGITYLGQLLRRFGGSRRLALIAYNAGPQHADDVRARRAVAYRETRRYLATIGARVPLD